MKFGSLDNMRITSSEPKYNLGISGKGLITSLGLKAKARPTKYKKSRYAIVNVSMKDLSKIIRGFERLTYKNYEMRRPKHDPTDSYFYLARNLAKFIMRYFVLNLGNYPVRTEMTGEKHIPISYIFSTDNNKPKEFLVDENLSQVCSTDKGESKTVIVDESYKEESKS